MSPSMSALHGSSGPALSLDHDTEGRTHTVSFGETLNQIAQLYGVPPQVLQVANRGILNPDALYPGTVLVIPEPPVDSVSNSTGSGADLFSTLVHAPTFTASSGATSSPFPLNSILRDSEGYGFSFTVNAEVSASFETRTSDRYVTRAVTATVDMNVSAGASTPATSIRFGQAAGGRVEYSITTPAECGTEGLDFINPFNPESIPTGVRVQLDGEAFTNTEMEASFYALAYRNDTQFSEGISILVHRTGPETVRVTAGPTSAVEAYNAFGIDLGLVSVLLGRSDELTTGRMLSADFDISTIEGRAAYSDFLLLGQLATSEQSGVSNVTTINRMSYTSGNGLDLHTPVGSWSIPGVVNTGSTIRTIYADGQFDDVTVLQAGHNVPLTIRSRYDAAGNEQIQERTYSYGFELRGSEDDSVIRQLLVRALTGSEPTLFSPVPRTGSFNIVFTQSEMLALREQIEQMGQLGIDQSQPIEHLASVQPRDLPDEYRADIGLSFAIVLVGGANANEGTPFRFAETMQRLANLLTGDYDSNFFPISATIDVGS